MRSAPNSKRNVSANGTASDGRTTASGEKPMELPSDTDALVYPHEKMLELFKVQNIADDFIINDCVFSQRALPPVCMTELSAKEQELLAGSVNSTASRRYNGNQHASAHQHTRGNNVVQRPNGHGSYAGSRARLRDADHSGGYQSYDAGVNGEYAGMGMLPDGLDDREADSLWADQMIGRESIGSFGADGVFRMGDDSGLLERPSQGGAKGIVPHATSPAAVAPRPLKSPQSKSASIGDYMWNDLAISPAQQQQLADQAEHLKWWYRDPQGNTQGPFATSLMQEWYSGGYFPLDLQVCHEGGSGFEPLSSMIDRIGQPHIFVYSAMVFLAQNLASSGLSTPGTLSRVGSSAQLPSAPHSATIAQPTPDQYITGSGQPLSSGASPAPAGINSSESLQTAQLLALLKEQLLIVTAIGERQHIIMALQEQQQQALAKLMRELAQETNSVHYKAQMEQVPVQSDVLYALQQHAQVAKEKLQLEYAQALQMHTAYIAQLETKVDPVIKDILLHNGSAFALNFIGQRLEELNAQIVSSSLANTSSVAVSESVADVPEPAVETTKPATDVESVAEKLEDLEIKPSSQDTSKANNPPKSPEPSGDVVSDAPEPSAKPEKQPKQDDSASSPVSNPAPWSMPATAKNKQPKKSLLQIQQEEEERRKAEEKQRLATGAPLAARTGSSYADSVGNNGAAQPPSVITEPANASSFTLVASKAAAQPHLQPAQPPKDSAWSGRSVAATASAPKTATAAKPQSSKLKAKSSNEPSLPSLEFLQWCYARVGSLRGVDPSKFIEMLLTFPVKAPESTLEIISEQIYAYSTTLNGRAFAEDFAKRRLKDHNAIKNGSAKSAPANWSQLLKTPSSNAASAKLASARNTQSSFQVVSKKGRK
ncbi:kinesin-like protein [Coemansia sp. RSA 1250]|nr:kinesin-like protein [Coemansia sp. RSA 1250]